MLPPVSGRDYSDLGQAVGSRIKVEQTAVLDRLPTFWRNGPTGALLPWRDRRQPIASNGDRYRIARPVELPELMRFVRGVVPADDITAAGHKGGRIESRRTSR